MWPPFPSVMLPQDTASLLDPAVSDSVRIRHIVSWSADSIGGRVPSYGEFSDPILVLSIVGKRASDLTTQMAEHEAVYYEVSFLSDPLMNNRDQMFWEGAGKLLTCMGTRIIGDASTRTWIANAEEHPQ